MIHEYAIEPELIAQLSDRFSSSFLKTHLGIGTPRVISRYPKRWKKMVFEAFEDIKKTIPKDNAKLQAEFQMKEKRLAELLEGVSEIMIKRENVYWKEGCSWSDNANKEHQRKNFHGLICRTNPTGLEHIICQSALESEDHIRWTLPRQKDVLSNAETLSSELASLLMISKKIVFIDPYFRANKPKWNKVFKAIFAHVVNNESPFDNISIELHSSRNVDKSPSAEHFKEECEEHFRKILKQGMKITFKRWKKRTEGEELHHRYILTDIGGIKLDPGFDERAVGVHTEFMLLEKEKYSLRWRQYTEDPYAFDLAEPEFDVLGK